MAGRSPARFLAPLALVAFVVALYIGRQDAARRRAAARAGQRRRPTATATATAEEAARSARSARPTSVKPGDTPSGIAEKTGVPLEKLEELNPDLDPQTLAPGQKIKLRE